MITLAERGNKQAFNILESTSTKQNVIPNPNLLKLSYMEARLVFFNFRLETETRNAHLVIAIRNLFILTTSR